MSQPDWRRIVRQIAGVIDGPAPGPTRSLEDLDETTQRRLILQAARECAPDQLPGLRKSQLTLADLDRKIRECLWAAAIFFWMPFVLIPVVIEVLPLLRMRGEVRRSWERWLAQPDPECDLWVIEGDIRRTLKALPRSRRREARQIDRELDRVARHWTEFHQKLALVRGIRASLSEVELQRTRLSLSTRVESETDPMTAEALQRQLRAVEGQLEALDKLALWGSRLDAARGECMQTLAHLRSQLALSIAAGENLGAMSSAAETLQTLNSHLTATQAAAEEVLLLRH